MIVEYDPEADALYIALGEQPYSHGTDVDASRRVDYAEDGTPIGIEILFASRGIDVRGLPVPADVLSDALASLRFPVVTT